MQKYLEEDNSGSECDDEVILVEDNSKEHEKIVVRIQSRLDVFRCEMKMVSNHFQKSPWTFVFHIMGFSPLSKCI